MKTKCEDCRYFEEKPPGAASGECRYHPPRAIANVGNDDRTFNHTVWPEVVHSDWCARGTPHDLSNG